MALRDSWKDTGTQLGHAFAGLGKSIGKTAKTTVNMAEDKVKEDNQGYEQKVGNENVYNDGTWRSTGKNLGHAFASLGKSIVSSVDVAADKVDDKFDDVTGRNKTSEEPDPNNTVDSTFTEPKKPEENATAGAVCSKCGKPLAPGTKFCGFCGTPVGGDNTQNV